jgi:hypothetical protein
MRWSVAVEAEGDRVMTREEIVELADAVAVHGGIASGIGTTSYGAQLVVEADSPDQAMERGAAEFARAATVAGLPPWPVASLKAVSEDDDADDPGVELGYPE